MGACEGSSFCKERDNDLEIDIEKNAYEKAVLDKGSKTISENDLEAEFNKILNNVAYLDTNVQVVLFYIIGTTEQFTNFCI